jgi:predicted DNA-binding transcriptional regulator AlpA
MDMKSQGYLNHDEAAAFVGLAACSLKSLNSRGHGPRRVKLGRRNWYAERDLLNWQTCARQGH